MKAWQWALVSGAAVATTVVVGVGYVMWFITSLFPRKPMGH